MNLNIVEKEESGRGCRRRRGNVGGDKVVVGVNGSGDGGVDGAGGHAHLAATKRGDVELEPLGVVAGLSLNGVGECVEV